MTSRTLLFGLLILLGGCFAASSSSKSRAICNAVKEKFDTVDIPLKTEFEFEYLANKTNSLQFEKYFPYFYEYPYENNFACKYSRPGEALYLMGHIIEPAQSKPLYEVLIVRIDDTSKPTVTFEEVTVLYQDDPKKHKLHSQ